MTTQPETVEALSHREVGFTVEILAPIRRWGPLLKHLQAMHYASTPNGDRNQVVNPARLADCIGSSTKRRTHGSSREVRPLLRDRRWGA
jgi:hypothetical protein